MKHKVLLGLLALGLTFTMAGCSSNSSSSGRNSISAPKKVSFVQQSKGKGTHVWFDTLSDSDGISKDDLIKAIFVMNNGKTKIYQIFDTNITLGKLSSMNDKDAIKLAKAQDKKYATTGTIEQIKDFLNYKNFVGQANDFNSDTRQVVKGIFSLDFTSPELVSDDPGDYMEYKQIYDIYPNGDDALAAANNIDNAIENGISFRDLEQPVPSDNIDKRLGNALIDHIKKTKYQEPSSQSLKIKNITDNSGNKIIYQGFTYNYIALYRNTDNAQKELYKISLANKSDVLKLIKLSTSYYARKDSKELKEMANADPKVAQELPEIMKKRTERNDLFNKIYGDKYSQLTKNIYGYHPWKDTNYLSTPTSQKIYKSKYIGYKLYDRGGECILTKAQNNTQKAVLSK